MDKRKKKERKVFKVFVSSTYLDNKKRRKVVQEAITTAGMLWHGMELFEAATRPTVEECLRHVKEADVLLGLIAWRYGWQPDGNTSITELEYDAAEKRLMFQLDSSVSVNPAKDFDPGPDKWKKQEQLEAFKQRFTKDQIPAYFTERNLGIKVLNSLNKWREQQETLSNEIESKPSQPLTPGFIEDDSLNDAIQTYCQRIESLYATLPVAGFVTQIKVPIDIEALYVPLHAMIHLSAVREKHFGDAAEAEKTLTEKNACVEKSLLEAFPEAEKRGYQGLVILGDPGSGKTTHLKRLLLWCLHKGPESLGLAKGMLPVYLPLRDLRKSTAGIEPFIEEQLTTSTLKMPKGFVQKLLDRGNLFLLFDGLDEVTDLSRREQVVKWMETARKKYASCTIVVTCRFAGYGPSVQLSENFLELHIRPLSEDQVALFVENWYRIVETALAIDPDQGREIAAQKAAELTARLKETDFRARRVFELTRNPLLLANICLVHRHRGALPHKRARLYEECIDVLLEHWRGAKGLQVGISCQQGRRALQPLAYWLHAEKGRTRASGKELLPLLDPILALVNWKGKNSKEFLRKIRDDSGLITGWAQDRYGFMHLGFQEYLAAREIRSRAYEEPEILRELARHFGESWWQEVILLLLSLEDPSLFVPFMRELVKNAAFFHYPQFVDACLDDAAEKSPKPFLELLGQAPEADQDLWKRQFAALRALEQLGGIDKALSSKLRVHPSQEIRDRMNRGKEESTGPTMISKRGNYELVLIPGGQFLMGSPNSETDRYSDEGPQHPVQIPDFYLGRYPVTNEQYGEFLQENSDVGEPEYWADRKYNQPQQPVVGVDWNDAQAYAEWAGLRLPSEAEWEYACRAHTRTPYYSGEGEEGLARVGWYSKNSQNQLHRVGEKEPNAFGLYDMHGNVDEWVEDDWHGNYDGAPGDGSAWIDSPRRGAKRVFRGGSWLDSGRNCRSAFRLGGNPGNRFAYLGFRLARACNRSVHS